SNAMKFTETGEISLKAEYVEGTTTRALLRFAVTDTGIGISEAAKSRIFDAFSQADGSTTRRYGGTGLGLSIAKQLVGLMGGTITVESTPGNGSTFAFTVQFDLQPLGSGLSTMLEPYLHMPEPILSSGQTSDAPCQISPSLEPDAPGSKPNGRILLAEDSPVNREVAIGMLEQLGYEVEVAENGRQALAAAEHNQFDVVLMDCQMPEMDGLTATGGIRSRERSSSRRRIPIIALTAHAMQGDREQCLAAGMDDYLSKPYTQTQLQETLRKWLRNHDSPATTTEPTVPAQPSRPESLQATTEPMDDATVTMPGMDLTALKSIRALQRPDRPDVLASVLRKYLDSSRDSVEALRDAIRANDPMALQAVAHRLKSSSAQLGATAVAACCKELEAMGHRKNLVDADRLFAQLQSDYLTACTVFRNEIAKEKQT
ncbi:MAG: response regulator, partial [Nitrospira sp.]|nr:response regulator [Nitrospira sp.]